MGGFDVQPLYANVLDRSYARGRRYRAYQDTLGVECTAVGRYSVRACQRTTVRATPVRRQPYCYELAPGMSLAMVVDGNIFNAAQLWAQVQEAYQTDMSLNVMEFLNAGALDQPVGRTVLQKHFFSDEQPTVDERVILPLVVERGLVPAFAALRGDFACVIASKGVVVAARDRHGARPLYVGFTVHGDLVACSSPAQAVQSHQLQSFEPLPPGTVGVFNTVTRTWTLHPYATPYDPPAKQLQENQRERVGEAFMEAVRVRIMHTPPGTTIYLHLDTGLPSLAMLCAAKHCIDTAGDALQGRTLRACTLYALWNVSGGKFQGDHRQTDMLAPVCKELDVGYNRVYFQVKDMATRAQKVARELGTWDPETMLSAVALRAMCCDLRSNYDNVNVMMTSAGARELCMRTTADMYLFGLHAADFALAGVGMNHMSPFVDETFVRAYSTLPVEAQPSYQWLRSVVFCRPEAVFHGSRTRSMLTHGGDSPDWTGVDVKYHQAVLDQCISNLNVSRILKDHAAEPEERRPFDDETAWLRFVVNQVWCPKLAAGMMPRYSPATQRKRAA